MPQNIVRDQSVIRRAAAAAIRHSERVSTSTAFFLWLAGGSLFLYETALGSNVGLGRFAGEYRSEVRRMGGAVLIVAIFGGATSVLLA